MAGLGGVGGIGAGFGGGLDLLDALNAAKQGGAKGADKVGGGTEATEGAAQSFGDVLKTKLGDLNKSQADSAQAMQDMATGRVDDVAQTMMRIEQASVSLQMATQVRNKVIEAYQEVIRMQV